MKKKGIYLFAAGALSCMLVLGTACSKTVVDEKAPAFDAPDAVLSLSGSIDKTTASRQISSDLFGIFLEDINYASYALDANMVCNGSFEYGRNKRHAWTADGATLVPTTQEGVFKGNAAFAADVNPTCAEVTVPAAGGSLSNSGYVPVPIALKEDGTYLFSAFVKASDYQGEAEISVCDGASEYAKGSVQITKNDEWVKYSVTLRATESKQENLALKITFRSAGTLYLDNVTLETNDATAGFKNYLYDAIADLSPAFIRFPGGCIIEGKNEDSAYDWKSSIGATTVAGAHSADTVPAFTYTQVCDGKTEEVTTYGERATRVADTDVWQSIAGDIYHENNSNVYYEMEYGIGFYEYFLLCESVGASAIPIVNCGLSCQIHSSGVALRGRHGNKVQDYIQDAKDLICFAKGSVRSSDPNEAYWAQVRTNMGHAEPFEMDYIGIGNEQWGNYFAIYYEKFLEEFQKYAEENPIYASVKPIVGNCTMFAHCEDPAAGRKGVAQEAAQSYLTAKKIDKISDYGVVDQHYYLNYTDFLAAATADLYAGYTRPEDGTQGYKQDDTQYYEVFVGEYSANSDAVRYPDTDDNTKFDYVQNSWITALSEAAMMTTYESNGDIVRLAAYAPMFGNLTAKYTQWPVNMMFYDNTDVVLTGNYFVQQLFMKNAGDHKIDSDIAFPSGETPQTNIISTNRPTYKRTVNEIYYVTSADQETGDIIVKIVNIGENAYDFNIDLSDLKVNHKGVAQITELADAQPSQTSSLQGAVVTPRNYTAGGFTKSVMGHTVEPYSVTAIRIKTK